MEFTEHTPTRHYDSEFAERRRREDRAVDEPRVEQPQKPTE